MENPYIRMSKLIKWCISSNTKTFLSSVGAAFSLLVAIVTLFAIKYLEYIEKYFLCIVIIITLSSVVVGLSALLLRVFTMKIIIETQCDDDILINDLIMSLNKELAKNKYQEVISIGHILNKPLFTIGKYELRLAMGNLVKKAAVAQFARLKADNAAQDRLNKYKEIEMIELIDSIGWMKVELGDPNGATDIQNGIIIAEALDTDGGKFYEAKAYRHLGAIERRKYNWSGALALNDKSLAKANKIKNKQLKIEAIAGAYYARAFVFKGQNDYANALHFLEQSISEFEKLTDNDKKIVKLCMAKEAKARFIFCSKQNENDYNAISTAKSLFEEALSVAEHNTLRLEMIRCYIGLAECNLHFTVNSSLEALQYLNKAKSVKIKCDDDQKRIMDIENKLKNLSNREHDMYRVAG